MFNNIRFIFVNFIDFSVSDSVSCQLPFLIELEDLLFKAIVNIDKNFSLKRN